jgi:hypothetical protein
MRPIGDTRQSPRPASDDIWQIEGYAASDTKVCFRWKGRETLWKTICCCSAYYTVFLSRANLVAFDDDAAYIMQNRWILNLINEAGQPSQGYADWFTCRSAANVKPPVSETSAPRFHNRVPYALDMGSGGRLQLHSARFVAAFLLDR